MKAPPRRSTFDVLSISFQAFRRRRFLIRFRFNQVSDDGERLVSDGFRNAWKMAASEEARSRGGGEIVRNYPCDLRDE